MVPRVGETISAGEQDVGAKFFGLVRRVRHVSDSFNTIGDPNRFFVIIDYFECKKCQKQSCVTCQDLPLSYLSFFQLTLFGQFEF